MYLSVYRYFRLRLGVGVVMRVFDFLCFGQQQMTKVTTNVRYNVLQFYWVLLGMCWTIQNYDVAMTTEYQVSAQFNAGT
jgi:hypothetical protein